MLLEELILVTMSSVGAALGTWETKDTIIELCRIQPHTQDSLLLVRTPGDKEERILGTRFCGIRLNNAIVIKGAELYKKTEIEISWTLISKAALVWNQLFSENCFNELTASLMLRFHKAFLNSTHTKSQVNLHQKNARFVVIFSQRVKSTTEIFSWNYTKTQMVQCLYFKTLSRHNTYHPYQLKLSLERYRVRLRLYLHHRRWSDNQCIFAVLGYQAQAQWSWLRKKQHLNPDD